MEKDTPKVIKCLNVSGFLVMMVGIGGAISFVRTQHLFVLTCWIAVVFIGIFMISIRVPVARMGGLFSFDQSDFFQIFFLSLIVAMGLMPINESCNIQHYIPLWKSIPGYLVVWFLTTFLMRLGARFGSQLCKKKDKLTAH